MDHFYIENWSPALDLYILLQNGGGAVHAQGRVLIDMAPHASFRRAPWGASGSSVSAWTLSARHEAADAVVDRALAGDPGAYVCLTNVHTTVESQRSPALRRAVDGAFLSVPDGMPLAWILRRRGHVTDREGDGHRVHPPGRVRGTRARRASLLLRRRPRGRRAGGSRLERLVPGVQVVGAESPPFVRGTGVWRSRTCEQELDRTKPHILWVGLGAPKQELWMARLAGELSVPMMIGVGAAFDYLAGTKPAAPDRPAPRRARMAVPTGRRSRGASGAGTCSATRSFVWLLARERCRLSHLGAGTHSGRTEDARRWR